MPLRFWALQASILRQYADNQKDKEVSLPVILPLLLYTGSTTPYPYSMELSDCFLDKELAKEVLASPAKLIDLSVIRDEDIKTHGYAALLELITKHIWDRDITNLAYEIITLLHLHRLGRNLVVTLLKYVVSQGESEDIDRFLEVIKQDDAYRSDAMTIAQQLELRGEQRGEQRGIEKGKHEGVLLTAKNMLDKGFDMKIVKEITGLSIEELAKLNTQH